MLTKEQIKLKISRTEKLIEIFDGDKAHKEDLVLSLAAFNMALSYVSLVEELRIAQAKADCYLGYLSDIAVYLRSHPSPIAITIMETIERFEKQNQS